MVLDAGALFPVRTSLFPPHPLLFLPSAPPFFLPIPFPLYLPPFL